VIYEVKLSLTSAITFSSSVSKALFLWTWATLGFIGHHVTVLISRVCILLHGTVVIAAGHTTQLRTVPMGLTFRWHSWHLQPHCDCFTQTPYRETTSMSLRFIFLCSLALITFRKWSNGILCIIHFMVYVKSTIIESKVVIHTPLSTEYYSNARHLFSPLFRVK